MRLGHLLAEWSYLGLLALPYKRGKKRIVDVIDINHPPTQVLLFSFAQPIRMPMDDP